MSTSPMHAESAVLAPKPKGQSAVARPASRWKTHLTPVLVLLLALAVLVTLTRNWNCWKVAMLNKLPTGRN